MLILSERKKVSNTRIKKLEKLHFYNKKTSISFLLPVGWEEYNENQNTVVYINELNDENEVKILDAKIIMTLFPNSSEDNQLLSKSSNLLKKEYKITNNISSSNKNIDQQPAFIEDFIYHDDKINSEFYKKHIFLKIDDVLFSISMICVAQEMDIYKAVFNDALESFRFITEKNYE